MSVIIQTNYSGQLYEYILTQAMLGNELANRGLIHILPDIKDKVHIPRLKADKVLQHRKPSPKSSDSKGDVSYSERTLEPKDVMVYTEFNPRAFEALWKKYQPDGNLVFTELPEEIKSKVVEIILARVSDEIGERLINASYDKSKEDAFFDGFVARITSASEARQVTTSETTMLGRLKALYDAIPETLLRNSNLRIIMSASDCRRYDDELAALPNKAKDPTTVNVKKYKDVRIEDLARWPEGLIVATICGSGLDSNLWAACALETDANTIQIEKVAASSELYFMKMLMKVDTNVAFEDELVVLDKRGAVSEDKQFIRVNPGQMSFSKDGGEAYAIVVTSGAYTIAGTHTGFQTERVESGLKVIATPNGTSADRTGTIELKLNGSNKKAVIELLQGNGQ